MQPDKLLRCRLQFAADARRYAAGQSWMKFKITGNIKNEETFASGSGIREISRLRRVYGKGRWRKRKWIADIEFENGTQKQVELHWYEATGIGRREYKIKRILK